MAAPSPASPRRLSNSQVPGPSSPRLLNRPSLPPHLASISSTTSPDPQRPTNVVLGFSPPNSASFLPTLPESSAISGASPRPSPLHLNSGSYHLARLSPQLTTPVEQTFGYITPQNVGSPGVVAAASPRHGEIPPRSRRNSAAIVSISLSSRSRSRTPRGNAQALPSSSGQGTPSKGSASVTPKNGEEGLKTLATGGATAHPDEAWAPGVDELDEWVPAGGMLLGDSGDEEVILDDEDSNEGGRTWTGISGDSRDVPDILRPGMLFGEGREFQGEIVEPAVGVMGGEEGDVELPLRRGGSEVGKRDRLGLQATGGPERPKKTYEVARQLGSGSYAVVYLVKEKGGRKREYALKCLSKQDLEQEQLETQLFEAHIHLSLPIHQNIVTLHQTLQTKKWLFLMLELCPGEDLFFWLEKSRDASPPPVNANLPPERNIPMSSSKFSSSSIPFSSSQMFPNMSSALSGSYNSPSSHGFSGSPASLLFAHHNHSLTPHHVHTPTHHAHHHNGHHHGSFAAAQTPPTPSLLSAFAANTLLSQRRLRLIASMFAQMCEAVAVCHDAGVSHRDIKPENFICCDSIELESASAAPTDQGGEEDEGLLDFGPQAKRKVVVKLTDFGLATTEEESGDVECGSKPYMSYECRNNLGPTYMPAPADVWSLGIVLINMLFHRNPWKDPTPGDTNFDNFLRDPTGFLLAKFTGIGREVATFLAEHVLCTDVEERVSARDFGKWIKGLPEMIGGRRAVAQMKLHRLEAAKANGNGIGKADDLFVKSPVEAQQARKNSLSALSALTSSAPLAPALSTLPPPGKFIERDPSIEPEPIELGDNDDTATAPTPELDLEEGEMKSATTVDSQPTPIDTSELPSPEAAENEAESRSLSTHKRRKRGVRKGKAAQAALAAAANSSEGASQAERDALLAELAEASQYLARDLSKTSKGEFDPNREEDFPPLGMTPAQVAEKKKSRWKEMMKMSSGNPEIAALAKRVAERDAGSGGNWSAPAKMQHPPHHAVDGGAISAFKPRYRHTATTTATSSAYNSSGFSSFGAVSSTSGTSELAEVEEHEAEAEEAKGEEREEEELEWRRRRKERDEEMKGRQAKARLAAQALAGMEPMGSFGKGFGGPKLALGGAQHGQARRPQQPPPEAPLPPLVNGGGYTPRPAVPISQPRPAKAPTSTATLTNGSLRPSLPAPNGYGRGGSSTASDSTFTSSPSTLLATSAASTTTTITPATAETGTSPNKPKLKGQIQSLAKMLSGLKTKGGGGRD